MTDHLAEFLDFRQELIGGCTPILEVGNHEQSVVNG